MCMDYKMQCSCRKEVASFQFKDEIMPVTVVSRLFCPACSSRVAFDTQTMVQDNSWVIEFDMDIARFMGQRLPLKEPTPSYLFDEGYCTWRGITPTDYLDSVREREELAKIAKTDPKRYLTEMKEWAVRRMERLLAEGWRKAEGSAVKA